MTNICRLCGKYQHHMIDMFSEIGIRKYILLRISTIIDIQISEIDPLPNFACILCLGKLDFLWEFHQQCRKTQQTLRKAVLQPLLANRNEHAIAPVTASNTTVISSYRGTDLLDSTRCWSMEKQQTSSSNCSQLYSVPENRNVTVTQEVCLTEQAYTVSCDLSLSTETTGKIEMKAYAATNTDKDMGTENSIPDGNCTEIASSTPIPKVKLMPRNDTLVMEEQHSYLAKEQMHSVESGKTVPDTHLFLTSNSKTLFEKENGTGPVENKSDYVSPIGQVHSTDYSLTSHHNEESDSVVHAYHSMTDLSDYSDCDVHDETGYRNCSTSSLRQEPGSEVDDASHYTSVRDTNQLHTQSDVTAGMHSDSVPNQAVNEEDCISSNNHKCNLLGTNKVHNKQDILEIVNDEGIHSNEHNRHPVTSICSSYKCEICFRDFDQRQDLLNHKMVHKETSYFICKFCGAEFNSSNDFSVHELSHRSNPHSRLVPKQCRMCGRCYAKIEDHELRCSNIKNFPCIVCEKRFVSKYDLQSHLASHSAERPFICDHCGKTFKTKNNMKRHIIDIHVEKDHTHFRVCEVCGRSVYKVGYNRHVGICKGGKNLKCASCEKTFHFKHNLQLHQYVHTVECPFSCTACGKTFKSKHHLKKHKKTHMVDKTFKCTKCEKSFTLNSKLEDHLLVHEGIRKYQCELCDKSFFHSRNLSTHMVFHGEKTIECSFCGKKYFRKNMLESHIKQHHLK